MKKFDNYLPLVAPHGKALGGREQGLGDTERGLGHREQGRAPEGRGGQVGQQHGAPMVHGVPGRRGVPGGRGERQERDERRVRHRPDHGQQQLGGWTG